LRTLPLEPTGDSAPRPCYRIVLRILAMSVHPTFFDLATPLTLSINSINQSTIRLCDDRTDKHLNRENITDEYIITSAEKV